MVRILDGHPEIGAHLGSNLCYLSCVRHVIRSSSDTTWSVIPKTPFFLHACAGYSELPSYICTMDFTEKETRRDVEHWQQRQKLSVLCVQEVVTPIYIVSYYIVWVTTFWTDGFILFSFIRKDVSVTLCTSYASNYVQRCFEHTKLNWRIFKANILRIFNSLKFKT